MRIAKSSSVIGSSASRRASKMRRSRSLSTVSASDSVLRRLSNSSRASSLGPGLRPRAAMLLAFAMGMQNSAANRFNGVALNSVFITGNLQKLGEGLTHWLWRICGHPRALQSSR